jgi:hypothetical protein
MGSGRPTESRFESIESIQHVDPFLDFGTWRQSSCQYQVVFFRKLHFGNLVRIFGYVLALNMSKFRYSKFSEFSSCQSRVWLRPPSMCIHRVTSIHLMCTPTIEPPGWKLFAKERSVPSSESEMELKLKPILFTGSGLKPTNEPGPSEPPGWKLFAKERSVPSEAVPKDRRVSRRLLLVVGMLNGVRLCRNLGKVRVLESFLSDIFILVYLLYCAWEREAWSS